LPDDHTVPPFSMPAIPEWRFNAVPANGSRHLWRPHQVVEEFRRYDPEFPPQQINTFLYIAMHEPVPMKELPDALGVAQSTMSRNVSSLDKNKPPP
jgi:DNA-binding MarR family transcriptional regulator